MENDAQRRELAALAQSQEDQGAALVAANHGPSNEQLEQLQALEEENTDLRQQIAELGAALCTAGGPSKECAGAK